jgi:hypothetical protein
MNHLVAVDDDSKILRTRTDEALTVVCLPYAADGHVRPLDPAAHPCLILHHEPPAQTQVAEPKTGSREFALVVARQQPAWTLSGHVHFTEAAENHFSQRIGRSWCFNCRQIPPAAFRPAEPNFILLDTKIREASWFHSVSPREIVETKVALQ